MLGKVNGDEPGAAAHPSKTVAHHVLSHSKSVDHHGGERRSRVKKAAVDDQNPNFSGSNPSLLEKKFNGTEERIHGLLSGFLHARINGHGEKARRSICGLP